jgi:hypothetical protein
MRTKLEFVLALLLGSAAASATTCEPLRLEIESKIKGAGVTGFTVTTVAASASAPGKVVGTCDQGSRKIMYLRLQSASGDAPTPPAPAKSVLAQHGSDAIVTECKDGSVITNGDCKK